MSGAEHGREDLLGPRAVRAPVPAADFAHHDGWANRVLGPPVRRVDGWVAEEGEQGRRFDRQMGGEALDRGNGGSHGAEQVERLFEQPAARDGEPVRGHRASGVAIAQREGLQEAVLHTRGKWTAGMIGLEQPTPTQEMRETRLMVRVHEAAVRGPAITGEYAGELRAEDGDRIGEPTTGADGVDRGVRGGEGPEPVQRARHLPPRLVGTHDRTAADLGAQCLIGRRRPCRRARTDVDQRPARDAQTEAIAEEGDDVRERQPHPFVQDDHERGGLRTDLHGGGAQGVGGLQRMPALHAAAAGHACADMHAELAHEGTDDWEIFLILRHDVRAVHAAATRRARRGQRRVVALIDPRGHRPLPVASVRRTSAATRRPSGSLTMGFGERGCLAEARAASRVELILKPLVALLQPIPLVLRTPQRVAQARNLVVLLLDQRVAIVRRRRALRGHALVMPEAWNLYKYKILDLRRSRAETR